MILKLAKPLSVVLAGLLLVSAAHADESLQVTVDYLISTVAQSDVVFVRNGKDHTAAEAANHMRRKYEHFSDEIETPEDFIRLSASKSLISGKPYTIRFADGDVMRSDEWLNELLAQRRQSTASLAAQ